MCKINNVMLHKVVKELNGIKVVHKNFPLDIECNKNLQHPFHQNACLYARYSIAAEKQGKWGQMNNLLFSVNPQSERTILHLARRLHFDTQRLQQDANSDETNAQIQKEIQEGMANRVVGTPMLIINKDNRIEGLRPYNELKKTLKKALKEAKANGQR